MAEPARAPKTPSPQTRKLQDRLTAAQKAQIAKAASQQLVYRLTPRHIDMAITREALAAEIKKLVAEKEAIDNMFKTELRAAGALLGVDRHGNGVVQLEAYRRELIDGKRLRLEQPDLAAEYTKVTEGFTPNYLVRPKS